jgi:hypothetical protein
MSQVSNFLSFVARAGTEFKAIRTLIGGSGTADTSGLATTSKNLVGAVNEVNAKTPAAPPAASTTVAGVVELATNTESTTGTATTLAVTPAGLKAAIDALVAGAPGALDTLAEIAAELAADDSATAALTTTVSGKLAKTANLSDLSDATAARTNLSVYSKAEIGDPETDFVAAFNAALA